MVAHDRAWRAFGSAQAAVTQQVRADLATFTDLTLGEIEVLDRLLDQNGIRMADLADQVFTSRSGLTRRIDRLERKGLVVRTAVAEDGRGLTRHSRPTARKWPARWYTATGPVSPDILVNGSSLIRDALSMSSRGSRHPLCDGVCGRRGFIVRLPKATITPCST